MADKLNIDWDEILKAQSEDQSMRAHGDEIAFDQRPMIKQDTENSMRTTVLYDMVLYYNPPVTDLPEMNTEENEDEQEEEGQSKEERENK